MKRWEWWLIALGGIGVWVGMTLMIHLNWLGGQGDDAIFVEMTENIARSGVPRSQLLSTVIDFQQNHFKFLTDTWDKLVGQKLVAADYSQQNAFRFHFNAIIFLAAGLSWLVPADWVWAGLTAGSFVGLLELGYVFLRRRGVNWWRTGIFLGLVSLHPAWSWAIQGQIYPDRWFLVLGFGLMWLLDQKKVRWWQLGAVVILSCLLVEKMMMIVGVILVAYGVLYRRKIGYVGLGVAVLVGGWGLARFYLDNQYYANFLTVASFTHFRWSAQLGEFFRVNGWLLGLALVEWRAALIALGVMMPNIFGSIGGAEKVGFYTHYHSTYFPILVWAAARGWGKLTGKEAMGWVRGLVTAVGVVGIGGYVFGGNMGQSGWWQMKNKVRLYGAKNGYYQYLLKNKEELNEALPKGVRVSAPEADWVALFEGRKLYFYPLGIDSVDYVVMRVEEVPGKGKTYRGYVSYLGEENAKLADKYLVERMRQGGFDFESAKIINGIAVIKRTRK